MKGTPAETLTGAGEIQSHTEEGSEEAAESTGIPQGLGRCRAQERLAVEVSGERSCRRWRPETLWAREEEKMLLVAPLGQSSGGNRGIKPPPLGETNTGQQACATAGPRIAEVQNPHGRDALFMALFMVLFTLERSVGENGHNRPRLQLRGIGFKGIF